jgi:hypothetical protein
MDTADVMKMEPFDRFCYWIRERHNIYKKRNLGKSAPWTDDQILQTEFFTNPYRENDKVSVWFRENVRDRLKDQPEVFFATCCFRWFNWIPTGEILLEANLLEEWNLRRAMKVLGSIEGKTFTGAFLISPAGSTKPKLQRVCEDFIHPLWLYRRRVVREIEAEGTLEGAFKILQRFAGFGGGGFMAYEVICDLRYTYLLQEAPDTHTWTSLGPGGKRGLNRVLGQDIKTPLGPRKQQLEHCNDLIKRVRRKLRKMPDIDMRTIEHSLCEFDKYERVLWGTGRSKRKYDATGKA